MKGKKTGGRQKGAANVKSRDIADKASTEGITPLEYMLKILRDESADSTRRDDMAKAAAPYMHPRLQATELKGTGKDGSIPISLTVKFV